MLRKAAALLACILLFHIFSAFTADFTGPVVSILNDDTFEVLHNNHAERIRLSGIDCPEKGQAYGKRAKQAASELVFGKEVIHGVEGRSCNRTFPSFAHSPHALSRHCTHACIERKVSFQYILMVNVIPRDKTNAVRTIR